MAFCLLHEPFYKSSKQNKSDCHSRFDCVHLTLFQGNYVLEQLALQFPDAQKFKDLIDEDWVTQSVQIKRFVRKFTSNGGLITFMVDQTNSASDFGLKILNELKGYEWTLVIFTESANNHIDTAKSNISFKNHCINFLINEDEFKDIVLTERPKLNLEEYEQIHDEDLRRKFLSNTFEEIIKITAINPREALKVLD